MSLELFQEEMWIVQREVNYVQLVQKKKLNDLTVDVDQMEDYSAILKINFGIWAHKFVVV